MNKKNIGKNFARAIALASFSLILFTGCISSKPVWTDESKLKVATSLYPLAELAQQVGGQNVEVLNITPAGAEPHEYKPTPNDRANIQQADILLLNGAGQEPWAVDLVEEFRASGVVVVVMSEEMKKLEEEYAEEGKEKHDYEQDPHMWLDPLLYVQEVLIVSNVFGQVDMENVSIYNQNSSAYIADLSQLHQEYESALQACDQRDFITSHAAFGYLARRYNLNQISIAGLSPEQEPSAKDLAQLTDLAREKDITTVFFESLVSPKLSQTLANEVGAVAAVLNPIEGLTPQQLEEGKNYTSLMRENLTALRAALNCSE